MSKPSPSYSSARFAAYVLVTIGLLGTFGLLHHPVLHSHKLLESAQEMQGLSHLTAIVHGGMIFICVTLTLCMSEYSTHRNLQLFLPRSANILFMLGCMAMAFGGLINGFIAPEVLNSIAQKPELGDASSALILRALWVCNQNLVAFGAYAIAGAVLLWALDLLFHAPRYRKLAIFGAAMAVLEMIWQTAHGNHFELPKMLMFWIWLDLWIFISAWLLLDFARGQSP